MQGFWDDILAAVAESEARTRGTMLCARDFVVEQGAVRHDEWADYHHHLVQRLGNIDARARRVH